MVCFHVICLLGSATHTRLILALLVSIDLTYQRMRHAR